MPSIAITLRAPKLADHPVRLGSIDYSPQHAGVTQDSNLLVGAATRGCVGCKGNQSARSQFSDENSAILHRNIPLSGTVGQRSRVSKNGLLAANPLEVTRKPAYQINQVNSYIPHGAKTYYFF